jgi:glycosyltransferase involved in cell wall biosynthesis
MPIDPPRVVAVLPALIPSAMIHVVKPLVRLHDAGRLRVRITLEALAQPREIEHADVAIFCRNAKSRYADLLHTALDHNIPIVYDLDDDLFALPTEADPGGCFSQPERVSMLTRYVKSAAMVRVHSQPLWEKAKRLNPNVALVSAPVDLRLVGRKRAKASDKPVRIVYATSRLSDELCEIFVPALERILEEYGDRVAADFWGPKPPRLPGLRQIRHWPIIPNYERFLRRFSREGYDIGLAPVRDDSFHRAKSNTKFRDYGACRIAGIYSNVELYASCVREGETGLLVANDPQAWHEAMVRLVEDDVLRSRVCEGARRYVEEHYTQEEFEETLMQQIERVVGERRVLGCCRSAVRSASGVGRGRAGGRMPGLMRMVAEYLPQIRFRLQREGLARTWNAIRWTWSSCCTVAYLRYRLCPPMTTLRRWLAAR